MRQLTFRATAAPGFIDLAECLSQVNRKAFKQGYVYAVESFVWDGGAGSSVSIQSLPTSWTVYNSWLKAKGLWNKMNRLAVAGVPGNAYPKYHDFKVFFEEQHYLSRTSISTNLLPRDGGMNLFSNVGREWNYSQYVEPNLGGSAPELEFASHMLGADSAVANVALSTDGSNAIIQMYGDTRRTIGQKEPEIPFDSSQSWATDLFDTGEVIDEIAHHLLIMNDEPPYGHALDAQSGDNPIYVGGSESGVDGHRLVDMTPVAAEVIYSPGGEIPLGLLKVSGTENGVLTVNVAPGTYNGCAALPMAKVPT